MSQNGGTSATIDVLNVDDGVFGCLVVCLRL